LLTELRNKLRQVENYPELQEAITKLEVALSILTVKTGGMLYPAHGALLAVG
jgi:hypothetical protein